MPMLSTLLRGVSDSWMLMTRRGIGCLPVGSTEEEGVGGRPVTPAPGRCRAFSPTPPCPVVAWILKQVSAVVGNNCCPRWGEEGRTLPTARNFVCITISHYPPTHFFLSSFRAAAIFKLSYLVGYNFGQCLPQPFS